MKKLLCYIFLLLVLPGQSQEIDSFQLRGDIKVTTDHPAWFSRQRKTIVCFYALPNGNTTDQTMGKKMQPGDDWHFDIQHIRAQTEFVRRALADQNLIVIYLENSYKSWPSWKQHHPDFAEIIPALVDSLAGLYPANHRQIYLNGHSGGGSFIFGYLAGVKSIPDEVKRISFIDSDYGYDSTYYPKLRNWLQNNDKATLTVFAYDDSTALYNGKPVVSATGGTWYRSHLLLRNLEADFSFSYGSTDSLDLASAKKDRIRFFFKRNLNQGIYHTQQVEFNGFIHSLLLATKKESVGYTYYGPRAYTAFIQ